MLRPILHCPDWCSFIVNLGIRWCHSSSFVLLRRFGDSVGFCICMSVLHQLVNFINKIGWFIDFLLLLFQTTKNLVALNNMIYYLTFLEIGSPKWISLRKSQGVGRVALFSGSSRKNSFSCTFQFLGAAMVTGIWIPPLFKLGMASLAFLRSITLTLTLLHPFSFIEGCFWLYWVHPYNSEHSPYFKVSG